MSKVMVAAMESHRTSVVGRRWMENAIHVLLYACAGVSVLTTLGIVLILVTETALFFREISVIEFVSGTEWTPLFRPQRFGILPLVCGTLWIGRLG